MNQTRVRALLRTITLNAIFAQDQLELGRSIDFEADITELVDDVRKLMEEVYEKKVVIDPRGILSGVVSNGSESVLLGPDTSIDARRGSAAGDDSKDGSAAADPDRAI